VVAEHLAASPESEPTIASAGRQETDRGLTAREMEILRLLATGAGNRQIGERLFISPRTVGSHVSSILGKLGLQTRGQAAAYARRHDLV
jgi:DNA-binding NarL/FixJ family response regulator